jgi:hypothetical protein
MTNNTRLDSVLARQRKLIVANLAATSALVGTLCASLLALL